MSTCAVYIATECNDMPMDGLNEMVHLRVHCLCSEHSNLQWFVAPIQQSYTYNLIYIWYLNCVCGAVEGGSAMVASPKDCVNGNAFPVSSSSPLRLDNRVHALHSPRAPHMCTIFPSIEGKYQPNRPRSRTSWNYHDFVYRNRHTYIHTHGRHHNTNSVCHHAQSLRCHCRRRLACWPHDAHRALSHQLQHSHFAASIKLDMHMHMRCVCVCVQHIGIETIFEGIIIIHNSYLIVVRDVSCMALWDLPFAML